MIGNPGAHAGLPPASPAVHSLERAIRSLSGARAVRVSEWRARSTGVHAHDWPILSVYVMGDYRKVTGEGVSRIASPAVVFHPAGEHHANDVGDRGLEQIDIEFDPAWLPSDAELTGKLACWIGGPVTAAARRLAREWRRAGSTEPELARLTAAFFRLARSMPAPRPPRWLDAMQDQLAQDETPATGELARNCGISPAWLAQAYRAATGEGLAETARRRRVERAASLLRRTDSGIAAIAAECGFCDQSHMNHTLRRLLDRTPLQLRSEGQEQNIPRFPLQG